jgi:hypothetical protein
LESVFVKEESSLAYFQFSPIMTFSEFHSLRMVNNTGNKWATLTRRCNMVALWFLGLADFEMWFRQSSSLASPLISRQTGKLGFPEHDHREHWVLGPLTTSR